MLKLNNLFLCDQVIIGHTGKVSLIGTFQDISSEQFPTSLFQSALFFSYVGKPDTEYEFEMSLTGKDNEEILPAQKIQSKTSPIGLCNFIMEIHNLVFNKPGDYTFMLKHKNEVISEKVIIVRGPSKQQDISLN